MTPTIPERQRYTRYTLVSRYLVNGGQVKNAILAEGLTWDSCKYRLPRKTVGEVQKGMMYLCQTPTIGEVKLMICSMGIPRRADSEAYLRLIREGD